MSLTIHNAAERAGEFLGSLAPCTTAMAGRGIVIPAGGLKYLPGAWVVVRLLRDLGCTLPIEIWHRDPAEADDDFARLIAPFDARCVTATAVAEDRGALAPRGGWELKSFAMLYCGYREVLLLDADNAPVVDPTYLFDEPEYLRTGANFWPDGYRTPPESERWTAFGIEYRDEPEQESGQILVDKERCWRALKLCNWYNEHSDFYYQIVYGDKDTFRFAWHRTNTPFAMPERGIEVIPATLCQHDMHGRRVFQHRFGDKWSLAGNRPCEGFVHEGRCREYLDELRASWNPLTSVTGPLSADDQAAMTRLAGRKLRYVRVGAAHWDIRLAEGGRFDEGETPAAFLWWRKGEELLFAGSDGRLTHRFRPAAHDRWEGFLGDAKNCQVRLAPA